MKQSKMAQLIFLHFRLILRNRRPKEMIWTYVFIYLYAIFHVQWMREYMPLFSYVFASFMYLFYSPLLLGWHSTFFDGLVTKNILFSAIMRSFLVFMLLATFFNLLLIIPVVFIYSGIPGITGLIHVTLFTAGVASVFNVYMATRNRERININQSRSMNLSGYTLNNFYLGLWPLVFYFVIGMAREKYHQKVEFLLVTCGVIGIIFLISAFIMTNKYSAIFKKRKYKILNGFRHEN